MLIDNNSVKMCLTFPSVMVCNVNGYWFLIDHIFTKADIYNYQCLFCYMADIVHVPLTVQIYNRRKLWLQESIKKNEEQSYKYLVIGRDKSYFVKFHSRRGFAPGFVNYKKGCIRLAAASDKIYQLLANGRWFSPGTPASSTTKTGRHDIAEILLKVA
jgi:hypothetical protein